MKKMRRRCIREFEALVTAKLDAGKHLPRVACENGIYSSLPCRWKQNWPRILKKALKDNGKKYKDLARIAELERLLGQAHVEIELLKKSLLMTPKKIHKERPN